jgi:hypothetical protein
MSQGVVNELSPSRVYALSSTFPVDGRLTWYPPTLRGTSVINCYLLLEGTNAMLIDTGLAFHGETLVEQVATLLPDEYRLRILYTRIGDYQSISNTPLVAHRLGVEQIIGAAPECSTWTDFGVERDWGVISEMWSVPNHVLRSAETIGVDPQGDRELHVENSALRLLTNHWVYDGATETLFTGDVFTYCIRADERGPWLVTDPDEVSAEYIRTHLVGTRYWWLPDADAEPIRRGLNEFFERYKVTTIAPGYGCVLRGEAVVRRHVELLDEVLSSCGTRPRQRLSPAAYAYRGRA